MDDETHVYRIGRYWRREFRLIFRKENIAFVEDKRFFSSDFTITTTPRLHAILRDTMTLLNA